MNMPDTVIADALAEANQKIVELQAEVTKAQAELDILRQAWKELEAWADKWGATVSGDGQQAAS